eukprot:TRINITY_DN1466_c1_g1_i1.p1 TRINITY_DN1466_c1_g1~~TRINITY_DN1466_c1_g1_i1.p1  ORF type:complete len:351 (-),score=88.05 TRINITY_DN1466_c1_g1_i1:386-1438(-)
MGQNGSSSPVLISSVRSGQVEKVESTLRKRAVKEKTLHEALFIAVTMGHHEMLEKILDAGADPNTVDADGRRPLHCAVASGSLPAAAMLLARGADPNAAVAATKTTALQVAVASRSLDMVGLLAERGAAVNATGEDGSTCTHLVARDPGLRDILVCLMKHGADVSLRDESSSTPLLLAQEAGCKELLQLMQAHCCAMFGIAPEPQPQSSQSAAAALSAPPPASPPAATQPERKDERLPDETKLTASTVGAFLLRSLKRGLLSGAELLSKEELKLTGGRAPAAAVPCAVSPEPEPAEPEDELACKICYDRSVDAVLLWCGHVCCCFLCSNFIRECPICRQRIARVNRIFLS